MPGAAAEGMKKNRANLYELKRKAVPYLFITPFFAAFLVFNAFPILFSFFLSFQRWNGVSPWHFNGIANFINLFIDDKFWFSLLMTFSIMVLTILPLHSLSIFFAFLLNSAFVKFKIFFKAVFFLPYITSSVAIGVIFWLIFSPGGILNHIVGQYFQFLTGLLKVHTPVLWINDLFPLTVSVVMIWKLIGWNTILYFAALQGIPKPLYEAARVDGASWPQVFFRITLPLIRPMIYFAVTMSVIALMQLFDEPAVIVGTRNLSWVPPLTVVIYLYKQAFILMNFGMAAATSYVIFIIIFILSRILKLVFRDQAETVK